MRELGIDSFQRPPNWLQSEAKFGNHWHRGVFSVCNTYSKDKSLHTGPWWALALVCLLCPIHALHWWNWWNISSPSKLMEAEEWGILRSRELVGCLQRSQIQENRGRGIQASGAQDNMSSYSKPSQPLSGARGLSITQDLLQDNPRPLLLQLMY